MLLPFKALPLRVAKFDVTLRERPLLAVRAKHTMLTRMVLFTCNTCKNRFPAFHPAFEPPPEVKLDLLRPGVDGVAPCNIAVAEWDELPSTPDESRLMAELCSGQC